MDVWDGTTDRSDGQSQRAPDRTDWVENIAQVAATQTAVNTNLSDIADNIINIGLNDAEILTLQGRVAGVEAAALQSVGAVETVSGLTVTEYGNGAFHKTVLTLAAVELATTDGCTPATDGAWASQLLYTFPTGTKLLQASHFNLDSAENNAGADGLTATADFDIGLGSVAVANSTDFSLTGTLSDYGDATVALTASASTGDTDTVTTPATHTVNDLFLNVRTVDDADHGTVAGQLDVTGTIVIIWSMLE